MINKRIDSVELAVQDIFDGATVMIGSFGGAGTPLELIHALIDQGAKNLTVVNNNTGAGHVGLAALIEAGRVRKMICSFPRTANSTVFPDLYWSNKIELELVPQGTLAERIRSGGAGIPAFFTRTSVGTPLAEGKEIRNFDGLDYVMERSLKADFALLKAKKSDRYGNLTFNKTARNFNPIMATAANTTIVQVEHFVGFEDMDPECVVTPSIYVNRVVQVKEPLVEEQLVSKGVVYP